MAPQPFEDETMPLLASVTKWGIIPGIALYLLWLMTGGIQADIKQNSSDLRQSNVLLQQHIDSTSRMETQQAIIVDLLRQQCINQAKDYSQRQACFAAGR